MRIDDKGAPAQGAEIQSRRSCFAANALNLLELEQGLPYLQIDEKIEIDLAVAGANSPQGPFQLRGLLFGKGDIPDQRFNVHFRRICNRIPAPVTHHKPCEGIPRYWIGSAAAEKGADELADRVKPFPIRNSSESSGQAVPDGTQIYLLEVKSGLHNPMKEQNRNIVKRL